MLKQLLSLLNGMILEKELVMSASLFSLLGKMKHNIAKIILDIHQDKIDIGDNSYLDIHPEKLGDMTMLSARKAERNSLIDSNPEIYTSSIRTPIGAGRLVRALLLRYGYTDVNNILKKDGHEDIKGRDIELFVTEFKGLQTTSVQDKQVFEIVKGNDIKKWYNENSYMSEMGTLGTSCMRQGYKREYLEIYCKENISLLILKEYVEEADDYGLIGRALIWHDVKCKGDTITFMDRIYYSEDYLVEKFKQYAIENGWWHKTIQDSSTDGYITNGEDTIDIEQYNMRFHLQHDWEYNKVPYMDTIAYCSHIQSMLCNDSIGFDSVLWKNTDGSQGDNDYDDYDDNDDEQNEECQDCDGYGVCLQCNGIALAEETTSGKMISFFEEMAADRRCHYLVERLLADVAYMRSKGYDPSLVTKVTNGEDLDLEVPKHLKGIQSLSTKLYELLYNWIKPILGSSDWRDYKFDIWEVAKKTDVYCRSHSCSEGICDTCGGEGII
jgi:hypothetical protein